jgi:hypothetical protein
VVTGRELSCIARPFWRLAKGIKLSQFRANTRNHRPPTIGGGKGE